MSEVIPDRTDRCAHGVVVGTRICLDCVPPAGLTRAPDWRKARACGICGERNIPYGVEWFWWRDGQTVHPDCDIPTKALIVKARDRIEERYENTALPNEYQEVRYKSLDRDLLRVLVDRLESAERDKDRAGAAIDTAAVHYGDVIRDLEAKVAALTEENAWKALAAAAESDFGRRIHELSPQVGILRLKVEQLEAKLALCEKAYNDQLTADEPLALHKRALDAEAKVAAQQGVVDWFNENADHPYGCILGRMAAMFRKDPKCECGLDELRAALARVEEDR